MNQIRLSPDHPATCPICRMMVYEMTTKRRQQILSDHFEDAVCQVCLNRRRDPIPWAELFKGLR